MGFKVKTILWDCDTTPREKIERLAFFENEQLAREYVQLKISKSLGAGMRVYQENCSVYDDEAHIMIAHHVNQTGE